MSEEQSNSLGIDTDKLTEIIRRVQASKKHDYVMQVLIILLTILGTWFVSAGIVYKDFPKQSELKEMRDAFEKRMDEQVKGNTQNIKEMQVDNLNAIRQIREDQRIAVDRLTAGLSDLKTEFAKLQVEIQTKEKYDGKRQ